MLVRKAQGRVVRNKVRQEIEHPTARQVANYIISFFQKKQEPITNLKLQKLLYYVQAWYLALYDEPLFDDKLEAWVHGASQPQVYSQFKQFLWEPITAAVQCPTFADKEISDHIDKVLGYYGKYNARDLERMIHREEPWQKARRGLPEDKPSKAVIRHEDMKEYDRRIGRRTKHEKGVYGKEKEKGT